MVGLLRFESRSPSCLKKRWTREMGRGVCSLNGERAETSWPASSLESIVKGSRGCEKLLTDSVFRLYHLGSESTSTEREYFSSDF